MDDRTRNEGDPAPDDATRRMEPPPLPGYGQIPPPPAPPMSTAPIPRPSAGTPGWTGPVSGQPSWTQPTAAGSTTYVVAQPGVSGLAKLGALVLVLFGVFWGLVGGAILLVGRALEDFDIPELQQTVVVNGETVTYAELAVGVFAGVGIVILVLAILEVLVGIFAWRGSGFARFAGTLYALIFGIPMLLIGLSGPSSQTLDGSTVNTTGGIVFVLVFAIGYLFTAFAFIFRWRPGQAR